MDIERAIRAILILGNDGKRILYKHFDQKLDCEKFDKKIFKKTKSQKARDDVMIIQGSFVAHRCLSELHIYIVGRPNEIQQIDKVLCCLVEVLSTILNKNTERQTLFDNLDQIIPALDEICDEGIILETDPNLILERVSIAGVAEPSMAQVLQSATEQFKFPWIRS